MHVLVLGGTEEGRRLAGELGAVPGVRVTSSLAGRVAGGAVPPGAVRVGGFGGAAGLAVWLDAHRVDAVVDATHPFAAEISGNAVRAAREAGVPLLAVRRPGWRAGPGDTWVDTDSHEHAAAVVPSLGARVFLSVGRQPLAAFAGVDACWFLVRAVTPPSPPLPRHREVVLARGPFTVAGERELLARWGVRVVVTKDSGGAATAAKLTAARELGLPVVVVRRPPLPSGVRAVPDVPAAVAWLRGLPR
ncbi:MULTISPECIES: cobalt-precorrin-6A reductase [Streptomyces]|uniref:cobalt-precorrin-6A reductase n=1 Tax=Streptomyces TaxID=1883 RepID=UPI0022488A40|nr:cobalt-precorrin-6A reductase [Streptomyces sp. JHD 1]MCX2968010.1 cobalt-precorrin-6A reductase [Streptomyces sp. JHD 1]